MGKKRNAVCIGIIEDNPDNLDFMSFLLQEFGYAVVSAITGEEGLEMVKHEAPDLVICDIRLPGMDGYEVARELKRRESLRDIPLVAISGHAIEGESARVASAGFDGYLTKPIDPRTFVEKVEAFLRPARARA